MEMQTVAKFWGTSPGVVHRWNIVEYHQNLQFMHIYQELNKPRGEGDPLPGQEFWTPSNG